MKTYILSELITEEFKQNLSLVTDSVVYISTPQKLSSIKQLQGSEEKIVVIDPDFVDWIVTKEDLATISNLEAVIVSSTSFGWLDVNYLKGKDIPLINVKDWSTQAVAEWAIFMALNLSRNLPLLIKDGFPLDYGKYRGKELNGKTAGVIGMGNIGKAIAKRAVGLGMNVVYWSKNSKTDLAKYVELEELFKTADYVFPTMADNSETQKLITDSMLRSLKSTSYFLSIVHHYYNHKLLIDMVKNKKLAGYGFEDSKSAMSDYSGNIWVAPEYAWCTKESYDNNDKKLLENVKSALEGNYNGRVS
jgi:lactate dehydrogenase-like 2-hydroxyacid dehydrogenase